MADGGSSRLSLEPRAKPASFPSRPGPVRPAEAVPGLVSAAVPVHPRQPVPALRPHTLHLWRGAPLQRGAQLRHPPALGHHWVAAHHLHGELRGTDLKASHVVAGDLFPCGEGGHLLLLAAAGDVGVRCLWAGLKERVLELWSGRWPVFHALDLPHAGSFGKLPSCCRCAHERVADNAKRCAGPR